MIIKSKFSIKLEDKCLTLPINSKNRIKWSAIFIFCNNKENEVNDEEFN
jgi:hypothetical protein